MTERRRALVVLEYTGTARRLLRHAGEHAAGCDLDLVLLTVMPSAEFQVRDWSRLRIPHLDMPYTVEAAQDEGARHARKLAREVLADLGVDYEVDSRVGGRPTSSWMWRPSATARRCSSSATAAGPGDTRRSTG